MRSTPRLRPFKAIVFSWLVILSVFSICELTTAKSSGNSLRVFLTALRLVEKRYVEVQPTHRLIRGALEGIAADRPEIADAIETMMPPPDGPEDLRRDMDALDRSVRLVRDHEKEEFDSLDCYRDAIGGMVAGLMLDGTRDHYSSYMRPDDLTQFRESLAGSFHGVGIVIEYKNGKLQVIRPIEDSPAYRAGIQAGDHIVQVDGIPLADIPITNVDQAAKRIRGPLGSKVTLGIEREGLPELLQFELRRAVVRNTTNVHREMLVDDIGYILVRGFTEKVASDVSEAVGYLTDLGMTSLVLDLRSNPGGLLDTAVSVADLFLEPGLRITYTQGREPKDFQEYLSREKPIFTGRMVVLMNQFSASASEIVAGALRDNEGAQLVGVRTFGKGSVQEIIEIPDDSALRLTVARYYTPSGLCIHGMGIPPDLEVAYELLPDASGEAGGPASGKVTEATAEDFPEETTQAKRPKYRRDSQILAGVELLQGKRVLVTHRP